MRETGLRGLGWGWRRPGAAWPNKGKCSQAGQWGAGRCVLGLRLWGVEGVLGRLLGPNRERGQRLGGGARPSRKGLRASRPGSEADAWSPETLVLQSADPHLQSGARGG